MSSFSVPPLISGINFDTSHFHQGMDSVAEHAHRGGDEIAHGIEEGMLSAEATMALFPPLAIELIENPILGAVAAAEEALKSLGEMVGEVLNHFQEINLGSIKTGLDPATLSTYGAAAKAVGVDIHTLENSIELLQQRASNALAGDEGAAKGFIDLGISAKELAGFMEDPKAMIDRVADAMNAIPTPGGRAAAAMAAMGKGGKEAIPFYQMGAEGIKELANQLGDMGARVGEEEVAWGKSWGKMKAEFSAAWEGIQTQLVMPILDLFNEEVTDADGTVTTLAATIKSGLATAMEFLKPIVHDVWDALKGLADFMGAVLVPVFKILEPIVMAVAKALQIIADVSSIALHGVAGILHGVVGDFEGAGKSFEAGGQSAHRLLQDIHLEQKPEIHIHTNVHVDGEHQAHVIAHETNKAIAQGYRELDKKIKADVSGEKVKKASRGGR